MNTIYTLNRNYRFSWAFQRRLLAAGSLEVAQIKWIPLVESLIWDILKQTGEGASLYWIFSLTILQESKDQRLPLPPARTAAAGLQAEWRPVGFVSAWAACRVCHWTGKEWRWITSKSISQGQKRSIPQNEIPRYCWVECYLSILAQSAFLKKHFERTKVKPAMFIK